MIALYSSANRVEELLKERSKQAQAVSEVYMFMAEYIRIMADEHIYQVGRSALALVRIRCPISHPFIYIHVCKMPMMERFSACIEHDLFMCVP